MESIESRIREIIAAQFCIEPGDVDLSADMGEKYQMDSLDQVELVMTAEDEFEIEIAYDDMLATRTAQQLIDLVSAEV
jgi:acyl carrier protein